MTGKCSILRAIQYKTLDEYAITENTRFCHYTVYSREKVWELLISPKKVSNRL